MDSSTQTFPPAWRRNLSFYLSSRFLGHIAYQIQSVAVGWQVYDLTHRALDLGFVGLVQFLPIALFSISAGSVADRFSRRFISLIGIFVTMLCALGLLASGYFQPSMRIYAIYLMLLFHSTM